MRQNQERHKSTTRQRIRYAIACIIVRPYRYAFSRMVWATEPTCGMRHCCDYEREDYSPDDMEFRFNIHWWLLYKTVFKWLDWNWTMPHTYRRITGTTYRKPLPWIIRAMHRIGETTAGGAISCHECHHCASKEGHDTELSGHEEPDFTFLEAWSCSTQDGTDHRFRGITKCPDCGYEEEYEDGSL